MYEEAQQRHQWTLPYLNPITAALPPLLNPSPRWTCVKTRHLKTYGGKEDTFGIDSSSACLQLDVVQHNPSWILRILKTSRRLQHKQQSHRGCRILCSPVFGITQQSKRHTRMSEVVLERKHAEVRTDTKIICASPVDTHTRVRIATHTQLYASRETEWNNLSPTNPLKLGRGHLCVQKTLVDSRVPAAHA